MNDEADPFYCLGSLRLFEARKLAARLEEEGIRFELEDRIPGTTDVLSSMISFGSGASCDGPEVKVFIHRDDEKKFRKISGEFFKV